MSAVVQENDYAPLLSILKRHRVPLYGTTRSSAVQNGIILLHICISGFVNSTQFEPYPTPLTLEATSTLAFSMPSQVLIFSFPVLTCQSTNRS